MMVWGGGGSGGGGGGLEEFRINCLTPVVVEIKRTHSKQHPRRLNTTKKTCHQENAYKQNIKASY